MKRFLSILVVLVLGLVITGCGSTPEQEALNNYLDEAKEITKIHELYVITAQKYEEGIKKYILGLEKNNVDEITAANTLIEGGTAATKYADELTKLKEARGV